MTIRAPKDFWAGLFFLLFGAFFAFNSLGYRVGDIHRLGPGMFPLIIGMTLAALGLALIARGFLKEGENVPGIGLRSSLISLVAVVLFGVLIRPAGLIIATFVLVALSAFAQPASRLLSILALGAGIAVFCAVLFVGVIGLSIPLWPAW
ncbi:MAG: tripartite tricarboxylate transporter TctB family protein [Beijerinckiaceae bacterium]|nr:tripartite tricarboxylate transporter TctB family protein [Beijerinckiaceae bacterium]